MEKKFFRPKKNKRLYTPISMPLNARAFQYFFLKEFSNNLGKHILLRLLKKINENIPETAVYAQNIESRGINIK